MNKANLPANMNDALGQIATQVTVGMDEVVSVFVARYETNLLNKKAEVQAVIKRTKAEIAELVAGMIATVDKSAFEGKIAGLGISAVVKSVDLNWEKTYRSEANTIVITIGINDDNSGRDTYVSTITRSVPMMPGDIAEYKDLNAKIADYSAELVVVMDNLKSVGRKERQVRGLIAEKKLETSGMSALLGNEELLKLVEL